MADKPDANLIQAQVAAYYGIEMSDARAADLAAEVAGMLQVSEGAPGGDLDQDPFGFATVLAALKDAEA